jgi:hypothetical protein
MKLKNMFILICISLLAGFMYLSFGKTLNSNDDFEVVNENNKKIDAKIYSNSYCTNDGKCFEGLIVYFNDTSITDVLLIIENNKVIAEIDRGKKGFIHISSKYLYQKNKKNEFFTQLNVSWDNVIAQYSFTESKIEFNSFDKLKKYGNKIIIKKAR